MFSILRFLFYKLDSQFVALCNYHMCYSNMEYIFNKVVYIF